MIIMLKRIASLLVVVCLLFSLCACGCDHIWTGPYCETPAICGRCEEISGEALGHDFSPATCVEPETCKRCRETNGEALGHSFSSGYCTDCGLEDPDYLGNLDFNDLYKMNPWVDIEAYNLSKGWVVVDVESNFIWNFYDKYVSIYDIEYSKVEDFEKNISKNILDSYYYDSPANFPCTYSYDKFSYIDKTFTLIDPVVDGDRLIVKALRNDSADWWIVPSDQLDFSTIEVSEEHSESWRTRYKIYFKN